MPHYLCCSSGNTFNASSYRIEAGNDIGKFTAFGCAGINVNCAGNGYNTACHSGCGEQLMDMDAFLSLCRPYFAQGGAMIDQPYQDRLREGMIRCYVVGNQVAGFGEQLINALYPAPAGRPDNEAPEPGPRLYFPADRPDFQDLKRKLEGEWIAQMCESLAIHPDDLPVLWDADFIRGDKSSTGQDTYVLCEINASSVYPFPPSALAPLVHEALRRCTVSHKF